MEVKVLKNINHQGVLHTAGSIIDLINADIDRLMNSGHITDQITEEDRKAAATGQPASVAPAQQQSQEQQAEAASPTVADTTEQENAPADTKPADQEQNQENTSNDKTQPDNTHTVVDGETLASIAETFGVTVDELAQANNIPATSTVEAGVVLKIPQENE